MSGRNKRVNITLGTRPWSSDSYFMSDRMRDLGRAVYMCRNLVPIPLELCLALSRKYIEELSTGGSYSSEDTYQYLFLQHSFDISASIRIKLCDVYQESSSIYTLLLGHYASINLV